MCYQYVLAHLLHTLFDDVETFVNLGFGNGEGRGEADDVSVRRLCK
jgi:hypothetical protein